MLFEHQMFNTTRNKVQPLSKLTEELRQMIIQYCFSVFMDILQPYLASQNVNKALNCERVY